NLKKQDKVDFIRGYAAQGNSSRITLQNSSELGEDLRNALLKPKYGNWNMSLGMVGEVIMRESNHVRPHETLKDKYGMPQLRFSVDYGENEEKMIKDALEQYSEMFHNAGF